MQSTVELRALKTDKQEKEAMALVILAGGLSERMGFTKALLPWKQQCLLAYQLDQAYQFGYRQFVVVLSHDILLNQSIRDAVVKDIKYCPLESIQWLVDSIDRCGPIGAIKTVLENITTTWCALMAVDMPFFDFSIFDSLFTERAESFIVCPLWHGQVQPLVALYHKGALPIVQDAIVHKQYKLISLIKNRANLLPIGQRYSLNLYNMNTCEDYLWAQVYAQWQAYEVPVLSVVSAQRKTGKTTLVTKLIDTLSKRGLRVAYAKSDGHGFTMDRPNSDTDQAFTSGATSILIASNEEVAIRKRMDGRGQLWDLTQTMTDSDLVILETRSQGRFPMIEVVPNGLELDLYPILQESIHLEDNRDKRIAVLSLDTMTPLVIEQIGESIFSFFRDSGRIDRND